MRNPFKDNSKAFEPMYSDVIEITSIRQTGVKDTTSLPSVVFPIQNVDPFADSEIDSTIKMIQCNVRKRDWCFREPMNIGDEIELQDTSKFKITSVELVDDSYDITARSIS